MAEDVRPAPERDDADADDVFGVTPHRLRRIAQALGDGDGARLRAEFADLDPVEIAKVLSQLDRDGRAQVVGALKDGFDALILTELSEALRAEVLPLFTPAELAAAIARLETDDAVVLLEGLEGAGRQAILGQLPKPDRDILARNLAYPEDSAGRLMQMDVAAVPPFWTVGQVIDFMRSSQDLPEAFYEIFVVDPAHHPIGTLPLDKLMRSRRAVKVEDVMEDEPILVPVLMDQEQVAHLFGQYDLMSAPVVDAGGRLIGMITVDDVVDVVQEEAEEDLLKLSGVADSDVHLPAIAAARLRWTWLLVNVATAMLGATVIAQFGASIQQVVALAALMPVVASIGGNAGMQTLTITVRALATRELGPGTRLRLVARELGVGALNGVVFASLLGVVAGAWFWSAGLGLVLAAAVMVNLITAGLFGTVIPLTLDRLKIDPAVSANVFLTALTDVVGFLGFLGLATLWLR